MRTVFCAVLKIPRLIRVVSDSHQPQDGLDDQRGTEERSHQPRRTRAAQQRQEGRVYSGLRLLTIPNHLEIGNHVVIQYGSLKRLTLQQ